MARRSVLRAFIIRGLPLTNCVSLDFNRPQVPCEFMKIVALLLRVSVLRSFVNRAEMRQCWPKSPSLSLIEFPPSISAHARGRAGRSAESARQSHVRVKGGPVALTTVSQLLAASHSTRPSSRDTPGREVLPMASSTRPSFSTGASFSLADGAPETEKTARESDNTYILRPIFQQRRVADGL